MQFIRFCCLPRTIVGAVAVLLVLFLVEYFQTDVSPD